MGWITGNTSPHVGGLAFIEGPTYPFDHPHSTTFRCVFEHESNVAVIENTRGVALSEGLRDNVGHGFIAAGSTPVLVDEAKSHYSHWFQETAGCVDAVADSHFEVFGAE